MAGKSTFTPKQIEHMNHLRHKEHRTLRDISIACNTNPTTVNFYTNADYRNKKNLANRKAYDGLTKAQRAARIAAQRARRTRSRLDKANY